MARDAPRRAPRVRGALRRSRGDRGPLAAAPVLRRGGDLSVRSLDHLAITVDDVERTLAFYCRVLDAQPLFTELWRAGKIPVVLLQVGASRLSVHAAKAPAAPHARVPLPGSGDFCFRWDGPIEGAIAQLRERGVEIALGPVPRPAADGAQGQSVYFRDPDGNLLELLSTDPSDP